MRGLGVGRDAPHRAVAAAPAPPAIIFLLLVGATLGAVALPGPVVDEVPTWQSPTRLVSGHPEWEGDALVFRFADSSVQVLRVSFPQRDVVRLTFDDAGERGLDAGTVRPHVHVGTGQTRVWTEAVTLTIRHDPFGWSLLRHGREVVSSGAVPVAEHADATWQSGSMPAYAADLSRVSLAAPAGTHYYGLGQRFDLVDHAHSKLRSWICDCAQDGSYAAKGLGYYLVPFFWTEHGWGAYLNSTADVEWDVAYSDPEEVRATDPGGRPLDLYLFAPGDPRGVFDRYTDLTGKPTLPPKWSFEQWIDGVYGTEDGTVRGGADAMRAYIAKLEDHGIAARSLVVEDWTTLWWFGARWQWNPALYADPQGFVDELKSKGYKVMLWEHPAVGVANTEWPAAAAAGYFAQDANGRPYVINNVNSGSLSWWMEYVSILDFTNPDALAWWREKHEPLLAMGIDGYKADGGEEVVPDMRFAEGSTGVELHALNAALYNRALYGDLVDARGEGAMISRSGTVGSQGASGIWNGDQSGGLAWTRNNVRAGLGASNSGLYWWTFDQGGLLGTMTRDEMLRNLQANVVSPWFKMHVTWDHPRPPWDYDAKALDTYRYYTNVRLQLLDYLYDAAQTSHETGVPLTRILAVDYPEDLAALDLWDEFLVGDRLLAAPVLHAEARERDIHLPRGTWVDLSTGHRHEGPVDLVGYDTPPELLPLFWRDDGHAPAPVLPAHPGLDARWAPNATARFPAPPTGHTFVVERSHFDGPVAAGLPTTAAGVAVPAPASGAGDAWLRLSWTPGPAFGWAQQNFLNLRILDADGHQVKDCGGGSVILCRIESWPGPGPWTASISVWTGQDIDWELAVHV